MESNNVAKCGVIGANLLTPATILGIGLIAWAFGYAVYKTYKAESRLVFTESFKFTQTNILTLNHYVVIPATPAQFDAMRAKYPQHLNKQTIKFE